jgi:hypothetical protein
LDGRRQFNLQGNWKEIARFLARQDYHGIVIIHSRNEETAAAMEKYDPNARLAPFRSFEVLSEMLVV